MVMIVNIITNVFNPTNHQNNLNVRNDPNGPNPIDLKVQVIIKCRKYKKVVSIPWMLTTFCGPHGFAP